MADFDLTDLNKVKQRVREIAREVDNVYTDVKYRAPMAELAALSQDLIDEIQKGREVWFMPLGDNHHNALLCPYCSPSQ